CRNTRSSPLSRKASVPHSEPEDNGEVIAEAGDAREPENATGLDFDPAEFDTASQPEPVNCVQVEPDDGPDPFNPATYRASQSLAAAAGVQKHLTELSITTPNKAWWVRRHPDPEFCLLTWVIELKEEQETYLVLPALWPSLMGEATF